MPTLNELYRSYLANPYGGINYLPPTDYSGFGIASLNTPKTQVRDEDDAEQTTFATTSLNPSTQAFGLPSLETLGKVATFAMNPAYGIMSIGFQQAFGKSPSQAIADALGFGSQAPSTGGGIAGTAADPSTMASEDPSAMGGGQDSTAGTAADPSTAASEDPSAMGGGDSGSSSGSSKIVCTMMNESYGFGSFRNKIWLKHSKDLPKEYEKGYHKIFLPLVKYAKSNKLGSKVLKKTLEHIAKHRTIDIKKQFKGKIHLLGRIYRKILEPLCYWAGKSND